MYVDARSITSVIFMFKGRGQRPDFKIINHLNSGLFIKNICVIVSWFDDLD